MVSVTKNAARQFVLTWKPVPGAYAYEIQRANGPIGTDKTGPWEEIVNPVLTDRDIPWTDQDSRQFISDPGGNTVAYLTNMAQGIWYRMRAFNSDGIPGPWSAEGEARKPDVSRIGRFSVKAIFRGPPTVPAAPVVTLWGSSLSHPGQGSIAWHGIAGGARYTLERSVTGPDGPWVVLCDQTATASDMTWPDQPPQRRPMAGPVPHPYAWYRVKAYNVVGQRGLYSPVFRVDLAPTFTMKF